MTDTDKDPMLFGDEAEQSAYRENVAKVMKQAVEEDRAARRQPGKPHSDAVVIGGTGVPGGLTQAV